VAKTINVQIPSVVTREKFAIREGEKANNVIAMLAAPAEKNLRVVTHNSTPNRTPSTTFTDRVRMANATGSGVIDNTRKPIDGSEKVMVQSL
jgi:hypothetical protein